MKTTIVSRKQALGRIEGWIIGESVVYYDDSMQRYYVGPIADLQDLQDFMGSDDADVRRDAYSHWCAGCTHGDGYEAQEEAEAAARATR